MTAEVDVQAAIDEMVRRLVERFDPLQIVLFGSHARGEPRPDSDVDLLMVLPEAGRALASNGEPLEAVRETGVPVDVIVRTPEEIWRECRVPGSVVRNALREGRVVYEHDERPDAAREMFGRARDDLLSADLISRGDGPTWTMCFHAQQAAEKALKAAAIVAGLEYPRTHELDVLRALLPEGWALRSEYLDLAWLSKWAVEPRYAGERPSREQANDALRTARAILDSVLRDLSAHGLEVGEAP